MRHGDVGEDLETVFVAPLREYYLAPGPASAHREKAKRGLSATRAVTHSHTRKARANMSKTHPRVGRPPLKSFESFRTPEKSLWHLQDELTKLEVEIARRGIKGITADEVSRSVVSGP